MQFFRSSLTIIPGVAKKYISFVWVPRDLDLHSLADRCK